MRIQLFLSQEVSAKKIIAKNRSWMNEISRKPAHIVTELTSARQHQENPGENWPTIMERAVEGMTKKTFLSGGVVASRQRETPRGAPRAVPSSSWKEAPVYTPSTRMEIRTWRSAIADLK